MAGGREGECENIDTTDTYKEGGAVSCKRACKCFLSSDNAPS